MTENKLDLSVVVPVHNEEVNIFPLIEEIEKALSGVVEFEMVYVNDGSTDKTAEKLDEALAKFPRLKVVKHLKACGQSQAIITGVKFASAPFIATLDGDGQNDPADLPSLYKTLMEQENKEKTLMAGHRHKRKDTLSKRLTSKVANRVRKALLKDDTPDTGCGTKIFPREAFLEFPHFDHMHRFLPALMKRAGGKVISVHVNHRQRERGASKYGFWDRFLVSVLDIIGVFWLMRRAKNPSREIVGGFKK